MKNQPSDRNPSDQPIPDGEERLATQAERDDVNKTIEGRDPSSTKTGGEQSDGK